MKPLLAYASLILALGAGMWFFTAVHRMGPSSLIAKTKSVVVPAHTKPVNPMSGESSAVLATTTIEVPEDGWITSFEQEFTGVPNNALRYSWVYDATQPDVYCPEVPRVIFVMSVEKVPNLSFPDGYGYFVRKGTALTIAGGFGNFSDTDYPDASMAVRLGFTPASRGSLENAYPIFLNSVCTSIFTIPPHTGVFVKNLSHPFSIPFDGTITFIGTHAHKYVTDILLTLNGKELWRTSSIHLPDWTNLGNPAYVAPYNGIPVSKGDMVDLIETYTNPTSGPVDAMSSVYMQLILKTTKPAPTMH